ncbi:sigma factor, partial [Planococcus sp. SIMBA_160]
GDRAALAAVVHSLQRQIYGLAMRMLAHPADAEAATQEILIKIITHLGTLRDAEAAGGWALKVASRHLVGMRKRGRVEAMRMTFRDFA